ncbi:hypothetical protein [Salibaculum sp.]|uniref:hypothetical protein n=1 Tax=Salibaculum sp. TaxID=2855480 RepID=UPI002B4A76F0|nr:hypothetical protein [Salibaculum sp.]HKL69183.1 hypothetical protein [Salibaculum sp.]
MYHYPRRVENYTTPFLWMVGVILFVSLWTIASVAGFLWVVISATGLELVLRALGARRR